MWFYLTIMCPKAADGMTNSIDPDWTASEGTVWSGSALLIQTCVSEYLVWATSWENLFIPYANNKGADQPVHLCSLISAFVVHFLDSIMLLVSVSKISSLYLASVAVQAGLCLTWSQTLKTGFLVMRLVSLQYFLLQLWLAKNLKELQPPDRWR